MPDYVLHYFFESQRVPTAVIHHYVRPVSLLSRIFG